jgi:hypothetical protein
VFAIFNGDDRIPDSIGVDAVPARVRIARLGPAVRFRVAPSQLVKVTGETEAVCCLCLNGFGDDWNRTVALLQ